MNIFYSRYKFTLVVAWISTTSNLLKQSYCMNVICWWMALELFFLQLIWLEFDDRCGTYMVRIECDDCNVTYMARVGQDASTQLCNLPFTQSLMIIKDIKKCNISCFYSMSIRPQAKTFTLVCDPQRICSGSRILPSKAQLFPHHPKHDDDSG